MSLLTENLIDFIVQKYNAYLTKELVYTAITRAKTKLKIATNYAVFSQILHRHVELSSGSFEKLADSE